MMTYAIICGHQIELSWQNNGPRPVPRFCPDCEIRIEAFEIFIKNEGTRKAGELYILTEASHQNCLKNNEALSKAYREALLKDHKS